MPGLTTVLLDTHVVYWLDSDPGRLSIAASTAIEAADEIAVAGISWFELAWLAARDRIALALPARAWLEQVSQYVQTIPLTPSVAYTAASLPQSFPKDPADRVIYATAIENGWRLVTRDERLRAHPHPNPVALW